MRPVSAPGTSGQVRWKNNRHHGIGKHLRTKVLESERKGRAWAGQDFLTPGEECLFLAFTTSSAFGQTDTPVLSRRVKILTVIQTVLSLVVVIVLVAWAVGTL
jgi:hypothetical protein